MLTVNEKIGSTQFKNLSTSNLQTRRFYSSQIENTPAYRIKTHLSLPEKQRLKVMHDIYFKALPNAEKEKFELNNGPFDNSKKYLVKVFNHMVACQKKNDSSSQPSDNHWITYPIEDAECLPGYGNRYSSPSAALIHDNLPSLLKNLDKHSTSIVEIGGFTFNDLFLLYKFLTESGIQIPKLIGIDVNQHGKIAAEKFNEEIAKIEDFQIHLCDASIFLSKYTNSEQHKLLIALRFLAVLKPEQVFSFFQHVQAFLKKDELFIFNYSEHNEESEKMQKKPGWTITRGEGNFQGIHVLKKNDVHMQTVFENRVFENPESSDLLKNFDFQLVHSQRLENPGCKGTDHSRGQLDSYQRVLMFTLKGNRL
jgi:hypothetical protein